MTIQNKVKPTWFGLQNINRVDVCEDVLKRQVQMGPHRVQNVGECALGQLPQAWDHPTQGTAHLLDDEVTIEHNMEGEHLAECGGGDFRLCIRRIIEGH